MNNKKPDANRLNHVIVYDDDGNCETYYHGIFIGVSFWRPGEGYKDIVFDTYGKLPKGSNPDDALKLLDIVKNQIEEDL